MHADSIGRIPTFAWTPLVALVAFVPVPELAWAEGGSAGDYQRIEPKKPNPNVAAVAIAPLCTTIVAGKEASPIKTSCPEWATAVAFCENPLDFRIPRPETPALDQLAKNQCPSTELAERSMVQVKGAATLLGVNWQDAVIQGLAAFLVERAKAEALAAAADRFRTGLCGEAVAKKILPLTCTLLEAADPYTVPLSWGEVKLTVEKDLHDLPLRVLDLSIPRTTAQAKDAPELLYAAVDVFERVMGEKQPALPLLVGLKGKYQDAAKVCIARPAACALVSAGIASEVVLQGYDPNNPPARFADFAARVILDEAIAAGLLSAETASSVSAKVGSAVVTIMSGLGQIESKALAARNANAKPAAIGAYATALAQLLVSLTSGLGQHLTGNSMSLEGINKALQAWPMLLQASLDKDYLTAVLQLYTILHAVQGDETPKWVGRYLPALAELAQAKDANQAKGVLEAIAAPVGSYRAKRGTGNRLTSINGYVGAQAGWEWLGGGNVPRARSFQAGVFAPVGLETSWGFGDSSSLGVLLSVLDLGAVVSFRTASDTKVQGSGSSTTTVDQKPEIGLAQVFSPGIYGLWGIGGTPLVFGVGGALTPELRTVNLQATGTTEKATAFRVGAFLAIDITILPF
jgi:hypothetical protein